MSATLYPPPHHATKRSQISKAEYKTLLEIPGVGPAVAKDLVLLGIRRVDDLKAHDPVVLYNRLCDMTGVKVDKCVKYTFRCAYYYATTPNPEPEKLKWWHWMDEYNAS